MLYKVPVLSITGWQRGGYSQPYKMRMVEGS